MTNTSQNENSNHKNSAPSKKRSYIIILSALVISIGVLGYFIKTSDLQNQANDVTQIDQLAKAGNDLSPANAAQDDDVSDANSASNVNADAKTDSDTIIEPGNPVVARFKGKALTRQEVFDFAEKYMGDVASQLPEQTLFPIAVDQLVNQQILLIEAQEAGIRQQEGVEEEIDRLINNHLRTVYLKSEIDKRITEDKMKDVYQEYVDGFKGDQEIKARHILLKSEKEALDVIDQLKNGGDFATLAKELSTGPSGPNGGDLGYFGKGQMVPEFESAAFAMKKDEFSTTPVKTQFGYHVILVEDLRDQQPPSFEEVKAQIKDQLTRITVQEVLHDVRERADVDIYDINGHEVKTETQEDQPNDN